MPEAQCYHGAGATRGDALPRPPLVPRRCHYPSLVSPRRATGPQHRAPFMQPGGESRAPTWPPLRAPRGGEWSPFRGMVARGAGGLNGACESRLGGRPALISAAPPPPQRRGAGTGPERPHSGDPRVPPCPRHPRPGEALPGGFRDVAGGMWEECVDGLEFCGVILGHSFLCLL